MNIVEPVQRKLIKRLYLLHEKTPHFKCGEGYIVFNLLRDTPTEKAKFAFEYLLDERYLKKEGNKDHAAYRLSSKGQNEVMPNSNRIPNPSPTFIFNGGNNVVGNNYGNITQQQHHELNNELEILKSAVENSSNLDDDLQIEVKIDIETLQQQINKPTPHKPTLIKIWNRIEQAVTFMEAAEMVQKAKGLVRAFIDSIQ